jgi:hypothetical protein
VFRKVGGVPGGGFGVILRDRSPARLDGVVQGGRYLVLEVGDRGEIGVWRRENDRWVDVVPWTPSAAVRRGTERNELQVRASGASIVMTVNGIDVARVEDADPAPGRVGVFLGGDGNEVLLERFSLERANER